MPFSIIIIIIIIVVSVKSMASSKPLTPAFLSFPTTTNHQPAFLRRVAASALSRGATGARQAAIVGTKKAFSPSTPSSRSSSSSIAAAPAAAAPAAKALTPAPQKLHGFTLLRQEYIAEYNR